MENKWLHSEEFDPQDYFGFVYKITNLTNGKFYIGKKYFYHTSNVKLGKKELAVLPVTRGRKSTTKQVIKESDWRSYWGSSKELQQDVKELGTEMFECIILKLCRDKKELTYYELHYQCTNECLLSYNSYNDNILGKFFRKDLV
jgi:hypothetical protein